jgi:diaminohydroxyphosphoribosylaminopyrimidine deaminase/5-amino-6-(5-phosphoribosylamino)uracil reductase
VLSGTERAALARAVTLAAHPVVRTSPNPTVGCVLLQGGETVGVGVTAAPPGPHAEVVALQAAGRRARGATAVVTLEPCAHTGRTPPCTDALVAAGVRRVVIAHPDPNPLARGGAARLQAAGIEVEGPLGAPWSGTVARQLEGFLTAATLGRPHVTLKQALTADGASVHPGGERWVTGAIARRAVHRWRASVDAVLVGVGTVLADDPRLDVRAVPPGPDGWQPRPVVLDTHLRTPPHAKVVRPGAVLVAVPPEDVAAEGRAARLRDAGAEVVEVAAAPADGHVDLPSALAALLARGIVSLLAEPGPTLSAALLDAGLVDRSVRHIAVRLGSGPLAPGTTPPPGDRWELERIGGAGADLVVQHARRPTSDRRPPQHEE